MSVQLVQFRVEITSLIEPEEGNGFVDNKTLEKYRTGETPSEASSLDKALEKERGNMRWNEIVQRVSTYIAPVRILDIVADGADANTAPTSVAFTLVYDREDYVYAHDDVSVPPTIIYGADGIKRLVAIALSSDITSSTIVLDPTLVAGTPTSSAYGESIRKVTAAKAAADISAAEAAITVTKLANT